MSERERKVPLATLPSPSPLPTILFIKIANSLLSLLKGLYVLTRRPQSGNEDGGGGGVCSRSSSSNNNNNRDRLLTPSSFFVYWRQSVQLTHFALFNDGANEAQRKKKKKKAKKATA